MECTRARATGQASVAFGAYAGALRMVATASCIWVGTEKTGGAGGVQWEEDGWFWSQTPGEMDARAWAVTSDGATNANRKTTRAQVRCVR